MKRPTLVDLFCGAGGFARGFWLEGYNIILGIDSFSPAARSYKANFPEATVLEEDIKGVGSNLIFRLVGDVDVVIGSPPCEPFTAANPNRMKDPLDRLYVDPIGRLVLEFVRIVGDLKPKVFVMENVPHIMEPPIPKYLRREFRRVGYSEVYFNVLKAEDHGTPSHRVRVFISNVRLSPKPSRRRITVGEALKGLPPPGYDDIPNHEPPSMSKRKLKRIRRLRWGSALIRYRGARGQELPNYIRLHPHRLAPTVLGSSRFIHPYEDRLLTVREQARLMGYPDYHVFLGGRDTQYNQVGESVPVPLSRVIAREVLRMLEADGGPAGI